MIPDILTLSEPSEAPCVAGVDVAESGKQPVTKFVTAGNSLGFTLIELLVVIAIVGILAAIAIPQFSSYRARSVDSQMKSDLKNASIAMESYFTLHYSYPGTLAALTNSGFISTAGVTLTINVTTPETYILTATAAGGTQPNFTLNSVTGHIY